MIVSLQEFKDMYNIRLVDSLVLKSLNIAHEYVRHKVSRLYEKEMMSLSLGSKHSFYIPSGYWIMDSDFSGSLSVGDIEVKEFNTQTYEENDISDLVINVRQYKYGNANRLIVEFSEEVPHTNYNSLYFRFYITPLNLRDKKYRWFLKEFVSLYAFKVLFNYVDLDKLQAGIANYNLNGVSLSVDSSTIRQVIEDIEKKIYLLYNEFMPLVYETFSGSNDIDEIYFKPPSRMSIR